MRIVVLDGHTLNPGDNPWTPLERFGELVVHTRTRSCEVLERARGAEVLVINKVRLDAATIDELARPPLPTPGAGAPGEGISRPRLRFIAVTATGHDCVDGAAARRQGIPVSNVPVYGTDSVAQFAFALILHLAHRIDLHAAAVLSGDWSRADDFCFWRSPQVELAGQTLGIVGFGRIGRRVAELAHAFGLNILAHDALPQSPPAWAAGGFRFAAPDELFARSDIISLHCPLTRETTGLVNRDLLRHARPHAILINTSRGGLVVEADLADALDQGWLAAAAVDVVSREPIAPDNPLLRARNCIITPHIAWATLAARRRLLSTTADNIAAFLAGRPTNVVNGPLPG